MGVDDESLLKFAEDLNNNGKINLFVGNKFYFARMSAIHEMYNKPIYRFEDKSYNVRSLPRADILALLEKVELNRRQHIGKPVASVELKTLFRQCLEFAGYANS